MEPSFLISEIRGRLGYKTSAGFESSWRQCYPMDKTLPKDTHSIDVELLRGFLGCIAHPRKGRSEEITRKASEWLTELSMTKGVQQIETLKQAESQAEPPKKWAKNRKWPSLLEVIFYVNIGLVSYGLVWMFKEIGAVGAFFYGSISIHALQMCKNRYSQQTAKKGVVAVWVLEVLGFFVSLQISNFRVWRAAEKGMLVVHPEEIYWFPFAVAACFSAMISGAAIYAVTTTLALTKEQVEARNFEAKHGLLY